MGFVRGRLGVGGVVFLGDIQSYYSVTKIVSMDLCGYIENGNYVRGLKLGHSIEEIDVSKIYLTFVL